MHKPQKDACGRFRAQAAFVLAAWCLLLASVASAAEGLPGQPTVVVVDFSVPVDPGSSNLMANALASARSSGSPAIVIEMNTPGGLLTDMTTIISI